MAQPAPLPQVAVPPPPPPPPPQAESSQPQPQPKLGEKAAKLAAVQSKHPHKEKFTTVVSLVFILIAGLLITIVLLPTLPKQLHYSVERASVTAFHLTAAGNLTAAFTFLVRAYNPHRGVSYYYDRIDANASYEGLDLVNDMKPAAPFYQRRRNATELSLEMFARDYRVMNDTKAGGLRAEGRAGSLSLGVKIRAKMRLKLGVLKVIRRTLRVDCGPFAVAIGSSNTTRGFQRVVCDADIGE